MQGTDHGQALEDASNRLVVCHVIDHLGFGGGQRQFVNLLNQIKADKKFGVVLRDLAPRPDDLRNFLAKDIPLFSFKARLRYLPIYVIRLARLFRRLGVTVVHTHMFWSNLYGSLAARVAGVPVVVTTEHGTDPWKKPLHLRLERQWVSRFADARVCVSRDILERRRTREGIADQKLLHIPNGVEVPPSCARRQTNGRIAIGAIGRFVWEKDYETLIRAASILDSAGHDFTLYILGDGPQRSELAACASRLLGQGKVELPGIQSRTDEWLRKFDIFVMSSVREGQPMVLLEAMAQGLPIVATAVGGIPDTVSNGKEAILVESGDADGLARGIISLLHDPELRERLGANAKARVQQEFSIQRVADKYRAVYDKIAEHKRQ